MPDGLAAAEAASARGVGGSAGGLDAYIRLLRNLPADMGVAIVIVNHITAMPSFLHEVLPRFTSMPVELITERLLIEPNHVFVIPENRDLHVDDGEFRLKPISKPRGWPDVITVFMRSLTDVRILLPVVALLIFKLAPSLCSMATEERLTWIAVPIVSRLWSHTGGMRPLVSLPTASMSGATVCLSITMRRLRSYSRSMLLRAMPL